MSNEFKVGDRVKRKDGAPFKWDDDDRKMYYEPTLVVVASLPNCGVKDVRLGKSADGGVKIIESHGNLVKV